MKFTLLLLCSLVCALSTSAQTYNERIYIQGGNDLWSNINKEMYLYPAFTQGTVVYKNGQQYARAMNFNRFLGTIQFIENKDTLAIANEDAIKEIIIKNDRFIYNSLCLQEIARDGDVRLLKNEKMRVADIRQVGALGNTNTSSSMESANQVYAWMNSFQLSPNEKLLLAKTSSYFIASATGSAMPSNKKNILKLFTKNEEAIKEFIRKENTNFNNEKDLLSLTKYIASL